MNIIKYLARKENFRKELWNEIDVIQWDERVNISIQITNKALRFMMKDEDYKKSIINKLWLDTEVVDPFIIHTSIKWIDYKRPYILGIDYTEGTGKHVFEEFSSRKDCIYSRKASDLK